MLDLLTVFGVAWMSISAVLGLYLGIRHEAHEGALGRLAEEGKLAEYHRLQGDFRGRVTVHAHGFLFALVCIALAQAMRGMGYPPRVIDGLAIALMGATAVWSVAAYLRIRPLMGAADFVFLGALLVAAVGLVRGLY